MENAVKYLLILESLKLREQTKESETRAEASKEQERLDNNLKVLKNFIKDEPVVIAQRTIEQLQLPHKSDQLAKISEVEPQKQYILCLQHLLLNIVGNTNFNSEAKEDLISTRHTNLCIDVVQELSFVSLQPQLHPAIRASAVFKSSNPPSQDEPPNYELLSLSIEVMAHLLQVKQFHLANSMDEVLRDFIAAVYTLKLAHHAQEWQSAPIAVQRLQMSLNIVWQHISKVLYFRNILTLKGIRQLPAALQHELHRDLLHKLRSRDGFATLVATLCTAQQRSCGADTSASKNQKQTFEVVANIVAFRAHSATFQSNMLQQIFAFLRVCLLNEAMQDFMGAGLLTLRRLYDLNAENKAIVRSELQALLQPLTSPGDLITGLIVLEHNELCERIALLFQLFCTSAVECLPSELLIAQLPLLLQLGYNMPPQAAAAQRHQLASLATRCLDNRPAADLEAIMGKLYRGEFDETWCVLHQRLVVCPLADDSAMRVQVATADFKQDFSISLALPELLISAGHHALTYHIFMHLLRLLTALLEEKTARPRDALPLLHDEDELLAFLNAEYPARVEVLLSLNTLVSHPPLRAQIAEHSRDFLQFLRNAIQRRVSACDQAPDTDAAECSDHSLLLLLTLAQELLEHSECEPELLGKDFQMSLKRLRQLSPNRLVLQRVDSLLLLLAGDWKAAASHNCNAFQIARSLLESTESHLQVYGIQTLLDLLRRGDAATLANGHVIVALALNMLKSPESYTFLNCVRLFVALVGVMEAEVLELLADEYANETASMDFRLVVGEALLKVGRELGPLCYKYKDVLLNCFMHGARSLLSEFRMSSFANLAQICRTLCFQVHRFFAELLHLIECELSTGTAGYLPAQRAAVLVLSELLEGIDDLLAFGAEKLLPVYRLLKEIEAKPIGGDEHMRVHAANGLKTLNEKCRKLFFPAQQLQKEIKILGIKDDAPAAGRRSLKAHILDMN